MGHLERGLEWLRPWILGSRTWDYCVVWKIVGDQLSSSRSIEWVDCCCVNGTGSSTNNSTDGRHLAVKDLRREQDGAVSELINTRSTLCRDTKNPHPVRGKACEYLVLYPYFMPLHAGIVEAILCSQSSWCTPAANIFSAETSDQGTSGTRVLIPVVGGLVELFAAKQILTNQKTMDFVASQFNIDSQMERVPSEKHSAFISFNDCPHSYLYNGQANIWKSCVKNDHVSTSQSRNHHHENSEGLSCGSIEQQLPSLNSFGNWLTTENNISVEENKQLFCHLGSNNKKTKLSVNQSKQCAELFSSRSDDHHHARLDTVSRRQDKKQCRSKNLVAERNRRLRIKRGLCELRALVPKISKMSNAATVVDAIDHIEQLKQTVQGYEEELKQLGEEVDFQISPAHSDRTIYDQSSSIGDGTNEHVEAASHVEVNQLTTRDFLLRILLQSKRHAFTRLIEALDSLNLEVVDANMTSCDGRMSNLLVVKANKSEIQAAELRDYLIELAV